MGYQSTLLIQNDALDQIKDDPEFGRKVVDAILHLSVDDKPVDICAGWHCNAATVIENHHANDTTVLAMGGGYGYIMGNAYACTQTLHTDEGKIKVLRELAARFGYTIHKKPSK